MNDLELAQLTIDIAWDIANQVDNSPYPARHAIHHINWSGPDPRLEFTATGFMLRVDRRMPYLYDLLTPWGAWKVTDYGNFTAEAIDNMLMGYHVEEVPESDRAHWNISWGSRYEQYQLYALCRFGDLELPTAIGTAGLGTGYAARHPLVLQTYPEDYVPYWDMVRHWQRLSGQLVRGSQYYRQLGLEQYRARWV